MLAAGHDIDPARYGQQPHALLGTRRRGPRPLRARAGRASRRARPAAHRHLPRHADAERGAGRDDGAGSEPGRGVAVAPVRPDRPLLAPVPGGDHGRPAGCPTIPATRSRPSPGSRLHDLLGDEVVVDSFHHQAVGRGSDPAWSSSARAADGVIEAIEMPGQLRARDAVRAARGVARRAARPVASSRHSWPRPRERVTV